MLFWEWRFVTAGNCEHAAPQLAVRDGRYKLLRDIADAVDGGRVELYDLSFFNQTDDHMDLPDYREQKNLATLAGNPFADRIAIMSAAVLKWRSTLPAGTYMLTTPCSAWNYPGSLMPQSGYGLSDEVMADSVHQPKWEDSEPDF